MKKSDKMRQLAKKKPDIKEEVIQILSEIKLKKEVKDFDFNKDGVVDEKDVEVVKKEVKKTKKNKKNKD